MGRRMRGRAEVNATCNYAAIQKKRGLNVREKTSARLPEKTFVFIFRFVAGQLSGDQEFASTRKPRKKVKKQHLLRGTLAELGLSGTAVRCAQLLWSKKRNV